MFGFELYVFFLSLFVFIALSVLFSFLIFWIIKQKISLIRNGLEDEKIKLTLIKKQNSKNSKQGKTLAILEKIFSSFVCVIFCVAFVLTLISSYMGDHKVGNIPAIKVVASTSMSERYERNEYLFENDLTNQLQLFDVVVLRELPPEEDLQLYDIVVYEHISGSLLIHRIVGIEEPNEEHPDERYFLLQGDSVHYPDSFPVRYSQMKSIYRGERMPNAGSFVFFMQSPAGMICLILVVLGIALMPIVDFKVEKEEYVRACFLTEEGELHPEVLKFFKCHKEKTDSDEDGELNV